MQRKIKMISRIAACSCLAVLPLTSCDMTHGGGHPLPQMTFAHIQPIPVYVASYDAIGMQDKYVLPPSFAIDPARLTHAYLKSRFVAAGNVGKFAASVREVAVDHVIVDPENKIGAAVGVGKKDRYTIRVVIDLNAYGTEKYVQKSLSIKGQRSVEISEFASIERREQDQMAAMDHLLDDLDEAIQKIMREEFSFLGAQGTFKGIVSTDN